MRVADFFCGGGGFSEGFRQAGFTIVFAVDKWEPAVKTYKGNKPGVNAIRDDVIRISMLPDEDFEKTVPDSEVIIGSPPCQSFSHSNKSGNADKSLGIRLIEAYLRIIARKKYKEGSALKYWVLENVPAVEQYIKKEYSAADLGLEGEWTLKTQEGASGKYNAKYFGAPTNRERFLCGEFPTPIATNDDSTVVCLGDVLESLGDPLREENERIEDINNPGFSLPCKEVTDQRYIYELADFECATARRLKQDKGYMGKMSFPENLNKPARTVMATMSASAREAMILGYKDGKYRLPTVREVACMMSFPIDYWFYGDSKATKHTLVGNAVPPKLSFAVAKAIASAEGLEIPKEYIPIQHSIDEDFLNLNGTVFDVKTEKPRRAVAKFKYHIPYLIIDRYRVELTNYHSDFDKHEFVWNTEIHYSQGKEKAQKYTPSINANDIPIDLGPSIESMINGINLGVEDMNSFQKSYCMTAAERKQNKLQGPYELLQTIKECIDSVLTKEKQKQSIRIDDSPGSLPLAILVGYFILSTIISNLGGINNGCRDS